MELAKKTKLDGFRPGKVPMALIEKLYGGSLWGEIIKDSLQASLTTALQKNSLNPVGTPHIESIKAEPGNDLEYTASFEVYPQVIVPELKNVSLEKLNVSITDADVDVVLEKICRQQADWLDVQREAQYGDKITFDLSLTEGGREKGIEWVLEEGKVPTEFAGLLHSTVGETLTTLLPHDEGSEKMVSATIQVQKIAEPKLAELNEAFAKRLGVQEGGVEGLRIQLRQHMQSELDRVLHQKLKVQLIDKLYELCSVEELPQALLDREIRRLESDKKEQQKQEKSIEESLPENKKEGLLPIARRRITLELLFNVLIEKYQLGVDEERVEQELHRLADVFQLDRSARQTIYKNENVISGIYSSVLEAQVVDKLLEEVEYMEKTVEYKEIMNL